MNIDFTLNGNTYEGYFTAVGDFAIHIEKTSKTPIYFKQTSVSGASYDTIKSLRMEAHDTVLDTVVQGAVYPIYIKIEASQKPTLAVVTFASDVQEAIDASIVSTLNTPV